MTEPIRRFVNEHRFLSNFYPAAVRYEGLKYPSVEHAYQAAKSNNVTTRIKIGALPTAAEAKRAGRKIPKHELSPYWDAAKRSVMEQLVVQKFCGNRDLARMLLNTGDAELIEGNTWGDVYWGICKGEGENHLGKILMEVRAFLRKWKPELMSGKI